MIVWRNLSQLGKLVDQLVSAIQHRNNEFSYLVFLAPCFYFNQLIDQGGIIYFISWDPDIQDNYFA